MTESNGQNKMQGVAREKYWDELTDSQKIERMRQEVRQLQQKYECTAQLVNKLTGHSHLNGAIVISIDHNAGAELIQRPKNVTEVRF